MRTTPTATLEVLLGLPPLSTWIVREAMAAFLRIRDAGGWRARGRNKGHAAIALRAEREVPISAMRVNETKDSLRLRKSYSTTFPSREQWKQEGNMFPPGSLVCYTDGSRTRNEYSGAGQGRGRDLENSGAQQSYSLGSYATVFQAEVFAILMVTQREDVKNCTEERIFICSDSQAALRAISSPRTRSMLVQECGDALESVFKARIHLSTNRNEASMPRLTFVEVANEACRCNERGSDPSVREHLGQDGGRGLFDSGHWPVLHLL
ncbi:hypothetical protein NQ315_003641 [Exocentrus adspersus]|uniref:RNase H type-1 domain-containing protein n=1 Tax=Exocentrus adspersus TaxID=1586481 RepID=A0AAV8VD12_9CUCU|nr:hypothetical protein NQ315_003641 [Exocentrus adspersus]